MTGTADRMLARGAAAAEQWEARRAHAPAIDPRVRRSWTLHHASACHDAMVVVYQSRGGSASRCELMVPGTCAGG